VKVGLETKNKHNGISKKITKKRLQITIQVATLKVASYKIT
jgi:hypothetical protein